MRHCRTIYLLAGGLLLIACSAATPADQMGERSTDPIDLRELLPGEFRGWKAEGEVELYDRESIFDYMNGAGEVYRMYAYRRMAVQRMVSEGQPEITIELFDMTAPEDAYGVFSHSRSSEDSSPGQGATYQAGLLCFWKSKYFVCIRAMLHTPETKEAVYGIAGEIDRLIADRGPKPALLKCIPRDSLDPASVRYFHLYTSLNYHYYLADQNILKLSEKTEAVFARYEPYRSFLVCIRYTDRKGAEEAIKSFRESYMPETAASVPAQLEDDRWVAAVLEGEFILLVLDAPERSVATGLMESAVRRLRETCNKEP
jgi:hypothetical protein